MRRQPAGLQLQISETEDWTVFGVTGILCTATAMEFRNEYMKWMNDKPPRGAIVDREVRFVAPDSKVLKVFRITGLVRIFPVYPSLQDAESGIWTGSTCRRVQEGKGC